MEEQVKYYKEKYRQAQNVGCSSTNGLVSLKKVNVLGKQITKNS
jgi:hypothetical protein